jgi:hypothetical protein
MTSSVSSVKFDTLAWDDTRWWLTAELTPAFGEERWIATCLRGGAPYRGEEVRLAS